MKLTKSCLVLTVFILLSIATKAQYKLVNDSAIAINELEYGYTIINIQSKEDYERYEIRFFIHNTGCTKYISNQTNILFSGRAANIIADFDCINATGKRLTSKGKNLMARAWNYTVNVSSSKELAGKMIRLGYIIGKGETIAGTEVILTTKGELPIIQVSPIQIREINN